ncbi:MAG: hypothetical protein KAI24_13285 [Planctomycetes bacterium]|nr:hypothetical protein [Planctomycetota bacterium]
MSFLKDMDLYKGIILLSVVLLPLGGWWISSLDEQIVQCEAALRTATKPGGYLEEIGKLQKQIEIVAQNRRSVSIEDPRTYFEGQILAVSPDLKPDDFSPKAPKQDKETVGRQKVTDHVVEIDWGRGSDRKEFKMDFVYAVLFNCESGASAGGASDGPPSVWRLRTLKLTNSSAERLRQKTPPPELEDRWHIEQMAFARREPRSQ